MHTALLKAALVPYFDTRAPKSVCTPHSSQATIQLWQNSARIKGGMEETAEVWRDLLSTSSDRSPCATLQRILQSDKESKIMFHDFGSLFSYWHCIRLKSNIFLQHTTSAQKPSNAESMSEFHLDYVVASMEYYWYD